MIPSVDIKMKENIEHPSEVFGIDFERAKEISNEILKYAKTTETEKKSEDLIWISNNYRDNEFVWAFGCYLTVHTLVNFIPLESISEVC